MFQRQRDGVDDPLAHLRDCQDDEDYTLDEHCGKGELPGVSHCETYGVHKESVESHARSEGEWFLGIECHHHSVRTLWTSGLNPKAF